MTKTTLEQVQEFHETYGLPVKNAPEYQRCKNQCAAD